MSAFLFGFSPIKTVSVVERVECLGDFNVGEGVSLSLPRNGFPVDLNIEISDPFARVLGLSQVSSLISVSLPRELISLYERNYSIFSQVFLAVETDLAIDLPAALKGCERLTISGRHYQIWVSHIDGLDLPKRGLFCASVVDVDSIDAEVAEKAVSSYGKITKFGDAVTNIGLYADSDKTLSDLQDSVPGRSENGCRCSGDDHVVFHALAKEGSDGNGFRQSYLQVTRACRLPYRKGASPSLPQNRGTYNGVHISGTYNGVINDAADAFSIVAYGKTSEVVAKCIVVIAAANVAGVNTTDMTSDLQRLDSPCSISVRSEFGNRSCSSHRGTGILEMYPPFLAGTGITNVGSEGVFGSRVNLKYMHQAAVNRPLLECLVPVAGIWVTPEWIILRLNRFPVSS